MRARTFGVIVVICCVVGLAAFYAYRQDRRQGRTPMGQRLIENLAVKSVAHIRLTGPEGQVSLAKGADGWQVENLYGYPAAFDKIAELVEKLRDLKVGRTFAADEDVRRRLALFDPQAGGARPVAEQGTRLVLSDDSDGVLADLLVGKARETDSATSGGHHLMRLDARPDDTVYLVDKSFRWLQTDPSDWIVKDLVDVKPDDVREVTCTDLKDHRPLYRLSRAEKGAPMVLDDLKEGEAPDKDKVDRVLGALSGFAVDSVAGERQAVDIASMSSPRRFEYRLFDGTLYSLETARKQDSSGDRNYLKVSVAYEAPATAAEKAPADGGGPGEAGQKTVADPAAAAQQADARVRPWTFTISTWKHEALVADRSGLFKQPD